MFVAYISDGNFHGSLICSHVSMEQAIKMRFVSGDLVFNDDNSINLSLDWLFDWEKQNENCYARKAQKANLNVTGYHWELPYNREKTFHRF